MEGGESGWIRWVPSEQSGASLWLHTEGRVGFAYAPFPGNTNRNILRGPGVVNVDGGLFRNFNLTERWKLQFRAESFNLTNTPHFGNPSGNVSNMSLNPDGSIRSLGNFMAVTSTASGSTNAEGFARQIRFGLRISF